MRFVSSPPIHIFKADNVIFACIGPDLNLNQLQRHFARIGKPMHFADRNIGAFILMKLGGLIANRDLSCS